MVSDEELAGTQGKMAAQRAEGNDRLPGPVRGHGDQRKQRSDPGRYRIEIRKKEEYDYAVDMVRKSS